MRQAQRAVHDVEHIDMGSPMPNQKRTPMTPPRGTPTKRQRLTQLEIELQPQDLELQDVLMLPADELTELLKHMGWDPVARARSAPFLSNSASAQIRHCAASKDTYGAILYVDLSMPGTLA